MKNYKTITVGIPAYNESRNISFLLSALSTQVIKTGILKEIILISDGSIDETVATAKSVHLPFLKIIEYKHREGKMKRQNEIVKLSESDILVLLDSDTILFGNDFIENLINPIVLDENVGLVGANIKSLRGKNYIQRSLALSHDFKWKMYEKIDEGNNIYLCHGRARAFSKKLYKNINWPDEFPEDAYSYLWSLRNGFKFAYAKKAVLLFKSPDNINDHLRQSLRFKTGKYIYNKDFSKEFLESEYHIPKKIMLGSIFLQFIKHPIDMSIYLLIMVYIKIFKSDTKVDNNRWEISESTKEIN